MKIQVTPHQHIKIIKLDLACQYRFNLLTGEDEFDETKWESGLREILGNEMVNKLVSLAPARHELKVVYESSNTI